MGKDHEMVRLDGVRADSGGRGGGGPSESTRNWSSEERNEPWTYLKAETSVATHTCGERPFGCVLIGEGRRARLIVRVKGNPPRVQPLPFLAGMSS